MILTIMLVSQKKKCNINFTKSKTKFYLSLHYNGNNNYLHINKKKICKFKGHENIPNYYLVNLKILQ